MNPRRFINSISLAITFLLFALILLTIKDTQHAGFLEFSVLLFRVLSALSFLLFIVFSISLFYQRIAASYDKLFETPPTSVFLSVCWKLLLGILWIALLITFISGVLPIVSNIPEGLRSVALWIVVLWPIYVLIVLIGGIFRANLKRIKERAGLILSRQSHGDWLSKEVKSRMYKAQKQRGPVILIREWFIKFAIPSMKPIYYISILLVVSIIISYFLSKWDPDFIDISSISLSQSYSTLWQVQAGIAVIMIPLLLFAAQIAGEQRQVALRNHEVMVRKTWVFPILVFALVGIVRVGLDLIWFKTEATLLSDFFILLVTLCFVIFAYYVALSLLFRPEKMITGGIEVAMEKMQESLDESIFTRLANRYLDEELQRLNIGYEWSRPSLYKDNYIILEFAGIGRITDIHLERLAKFVNDLPKEAPFTASVLETPDEFKIEGAQIPAQSKKQSVWIMKRIGDMVSKTDNTIVMIDKNVYRDLHKIDLEQKIKRVLRISSRDEW